MAEAVRYYTAQKARLLRQYDSYVRRMRAVLAAELRDMDVDALIQETRAEYDQLIPQLPDIGGKQPFTQFLAFTALWLALYRAAQRRGKTVQEVGKLIFEICRAIMHIYPEFLALLMGGVNFSPIYLKNLRRRAARSRLSSYPDDYVYDFVEGDGETFDYGVDYVQCAACRFLERQQALELAPYLCPVDILYSERLGWGLQRTMTLADGAQRCDFRFKRGGATRVAVPASMQHLVVKGIKR